MSPARSGPRWLRLLGGVLVVLIAVVGWWVQSGPGSSGDDGATPSGAPSTSYTGSAEQPGDGEPTGPTASADPPRAEIDPVSGLRWVSLDDLPREARRTVVLIEAGGPFPYDRDGVTFGNYEGVLPQRGRGYYTEYTVPTPGLNHRGARRIVTGQDDEYYFTADHYASFERIEQ